MKNIVLCGSMKVKDKIFEVEENIVIPDSYSYRDVLTNVLNQGNQQICVPCTLSAYLNWKENLKDGSNKDNKIKLINLNLDFINIILLFFTI